MRSSAFLSLLVVGISALGIGACANSGRNRGTADGGSTLCGNGSLETGEACDDGNVVDGDGCDGLCRLEGDGTCGNGVTEAPEACDDGNTNDGDGCSSRCAVEGAPAACGDGRRDEDEECDDANHEAGDGCSPTCTIEVLESCGDGVLDDGEECDDGEANSDESPDACRLGCRLAHCGDGVIDDAEVCDDGSANNDATADACRTTCVLPRCGDGVADTDEACDDGNASDEDACLGTCVAAECGDGIVQLGVEACDDGSANDDLTADACRTNCVEATCGDSVVDTVEDCDDGNLDDTDDCLTGCVDARCGDGFLHDGVETCDDGAGNSDTTPDACRLDCGEARCGDGVLDSGEACDDGNRIDGDACRNTCVSATCGDGIVQPPGEECDDGAANSNSTANACRENCVDAYCGDHVVDLGEACDDGNRRNTDACVGMCVRATCGDGYVRRGVEECDDGAANSDREANACRTDCAAASCGDGVTDDGEVCDDGNAIDGDGCDSNCTPSGCGNGIVAGIEECDDGNLVPGDGCNRTCRREFCGDGAVNDRGTEQCDDGNEASGDCCSSACRIEAHCELEANNNRPTANNFRSLQLDNRLRGFVNPTGDVDYFLLHVAGGATVELRAATVDGPGSTCAGGNLDSEIELRDSTGALLDSDDDGGESLCSLLTVAALAPGDYYLVVKASRYAPTRTFGYTLEVEVGAIVCGNDDAQSGEICDGSDLAGTTCVSLGYARGTLLCAAMCDAFDESMCVPSVCGNDAVETGEQCDDGGTMTGDGCDGSCQLERTPEVEPNDDGMPEVRQTGESSLDGNDFSSADANGPYSENTLIEAAFSVAGDEDVYALTNTTGSAVDVTLTTYGSTFGACNLDTVINIRDAAGTRLARNDDSGIGLCSELVYSLGAGETVYVHLVEYGDNATGAYLLHIRFP